MTDKPMTIQEVVQFTGRTCRLIYRAMDENRLPFTTIDGRRYFDRLEVIKSYGDDQRTPAPAYDLIDCRGVRKWFAWPCG